MKTCSKCGVPKEHSEFHRNRSRPDGLKHICRACCKLPGADGLTNYQRNREKVGADGLTNRQRSDKKVGADGLTNSQRNNKKVGADGMTYSQRFYRKIGEDGLTNSQRKDKDGLTKSQRYHKKNPESQRGRSLKKRYQITIEDFNRLLAEQEGKCAICRSAPPVNRSLDVDHSHKSGKVRGLLCNSCNAGLGFFKENPLLLLRARHYLYDHLGD